MNSDQDIFERLAEEGPVSANNLLKDDEILSEEDKQKPDTSCKPNDGAEKKPKKPCANCTCGLADELENEAKEQVQKVTTSVEKSSCGSCYLGDAFRCASCPYKGMPAFKPGEKVQISLDSDDL